MVQRFTRFHLTLRFDFQLRELLYIAAEHRAYHRTHVSFEVHEIHFENRLTCDNGSAFFRQPGKALTRQRNGINPHMHHDLSAIFGFKTEGMISVENLDESTRRG